MSDHSNELWRNVVGYEGLYQVSNQGRVKSLTREFRKKNRWGSYTMFHVNERILKLKNTKNGHLTVTLCSDTQKTHWIHRLVLEAFVGPCPRGMECRHFPDRDPTNNRPENLRWGTKKENQADRIIHGTHDRGERNGHAKLTESKVLAIRKASGTLQEIADRFDISFQHVSLIKLRKTWRHI